MAKSKKRDVFDELMEGVGSMQAHREGRITLRSHRVPPLSLPRVNERVIRSTRERLRMSRRVAAGRTIKLRR
jgi:putative transcriptional regulator